MTTPPPNVIAVNEGLEARRNGKPRVSPYAGIKALRAFHRGWLKGWDAGSPGHDAFAKDQSAA